MRQPVSIGGLIDGVWGEDEPASAKKAVQVHIHHLRTQLGDSLRTEVIWPPTLELFPHEHKMWSTVGIYGGVEDNT
ncbi:MAG: hypothetical protein HKN93_05415, partial [Acidimicrobiia bacterium]|nr:hypothetical protein [Acidimicrobiia bacterium]